MILAQVKTRFLTETAKSTNPAEAADNAVRTAVQQRRTFYAPSNSENLTPTDFKSAFANQLLAHLDRYRSPVEHDEHCQIILSLADTLTKEFASTLAGGRLNIGTAQKGLNLFLKTIWCIDPTFPIPPHCPIDRAALEHSGILGNWTQLDDIAKYRHWIDGMRLQARQDGYDNLAEWELLNWPIWTFPKTAVCPGTVPVTLENGVGYTFDWKPARED